jgi:hypothetical protein
MGHRVVEAADIHIQDQSSLETMIDKEAKGDNVVLVIRSSFSWLLEWSSHLRQTADIAAFPGMCFARSCSWQSSYIAVTLAMQFHI